MPQGRIVNLRFVQEQDAGFVYGLRSDPKLNEHLSPVTGGVETQQAWIARYKEREVRGEEAYFVAERMDGVPCGLVRLYDISDDAFVFGSFMMGHNKPKLAALETACLAFAYGFDEFKRPIGKLDVRRKNARAIHFYRRFGAREVRQDDQDLFFEISRAEFQKQRSLFDASIRAHLEEQ